MSKRLDEVMQLVSGVGKQKEEVRTEAASSSGVKSDRLKEVQKYTALLPMRYQEAQDAGKRSMLQSQFQQGLQQSQADDTPETPMSPTAFVNQRLGQTEQQQREQRLQTARVTGELSRQMQEDPTQYQRTMAQKQAMEAVTKLQEARQKVETVQAKEQELMTRQTGLENSYTALQGLLEQYQRTGNDVDGKAYLLAAQQYEEMRTQFNADLEQYQKDAAAYDQYNSAWERAQKAQASYEKAQADYLEEHPAEKYQDAGLLEIYGVMQGLRAEIDADYEKAYANGTYKKWEDLNALYKQKALENNGLWNSGAADFADRVLTATEAGQMDWMAGVATLERKAGNALLRIASTTLGNVADMIGSESLKEKSKELLEKSKSTSPDAEAAKEASRSLMLDALTGTGKIDGWIIQQMESVGAMWMDAFTAGASGAMGLMEGATSLQIMGTRAAGSAMLDAQEKGYSEMEQLMVGAAVGGLEVISEKLFGGNPLYDTDKGLVNRLVEKITQNPTILRLMYSRGFDIMGEGLEEVFTEILDPVAEAILTGSADVDWASVDEIEQAFLGGVFLGLMGQGVDVAVDAAANSGTRKAYRELGAQMVKADAVQEVIAEGLEADPRSEAYQNAVKLQKKLDAGREVTVREVGQQLMANQEAIEAGLLVDQEVEPVQDAPEGALQDPEEGFYAIQIEQGANGKAEFRLVEVAPDGSISYKSNTMVTSLFDAKITAEIEGLNIRQIGTSASLRAAVEAKGEETVTSEAETEAEEERIATAPAEPRNDSAEMEMPTETEGIQWAGNMPDTETVNGGTDYGTEQQEAEYQTAGDGGNQERSRGNADGQAARSPRQQFARDALRRAEEARRVQSHVQTVGGELVSLREQGLSNGSTDRTVWTVPKEAWTTEIQDAAEIAESEGLEFIPLSGAMYINYGKGEARINGAVEDGKVFVQTDSTKMDAREITMHEVFHEKAAKDATLVPRLVQMIREKYTREQTEEMLQRYYDAYQEIYSGRASDEALEEMIWEEMLADAYAEFQRFLDADASQFGMDVQEAVWSRAKKNQGETGNARYSFAGRNAKMADSASLALAEQMEQDGAEAQEIWDETRWYRGMDGQWRFEIDDSGMKYYRGGDAEFRKRYPEYAEYRDLQVRQLYEYGTEKWTGEDQKRLDYLHELYKSEPKRMNEKLNGGLATLSDILDHKELFKNYPQLSNTKVQFVAMQEGTRGRYDPVTDTITINKELKNKPESTLLHEIQHAIQEAEGFTGGSSAAYWAFEMQRNDPNRYEDPRITRAEKKYRDLFNGAPEEMKDKVREINRAKLDKNWDEVLRLETAMYEGPYANLYSELEDANFAWMDARERFRETDPHELYKNTAGEIEARDVGKRRNMTTEQRRATMPDLGNENTVFADKARFSLDGHEEDLPDLIAQGTEQAATMEPVQEMDGTEFAKGEKPLEDQVAEYFSSIGNRAEHPILGEVILNRRGAKDDLSHGIGRKKAITFMAVPDVIAKGGLIDYQENWKGRGYDTAVIAAPVTIAGDRYLMGVVLKRTNRGNAFYVHEVLAESEEGATPFKTGAVKNGLTGGDTPSVLSLLQKVMNVKRGNVRYSLEDDLDSMNREELQEKLSDLRREYNDLQTRDFQYRESKEYKEIIGEIEEGKGARKSIFDKPEELDKALKKYVAWQDESGYTDVLNRMEQIRNNMKKLDSAITRAKERDAKAAKEKYRSQYSTELASKYATKAARKFGTTSRFDLAGYLTTNGTLLDFSAHQGYRVRDHREIAEVLDFLPEEHGYSDGLVEFMNLGNIRMQSYGIDISKAPNEKQLPVLRRFFNSMNGEVTVDFSRENGDTDGSIDYPEGTKADRILRDIDNYFKTGTVPELSTMDQFHTRYSLDTKQTKEDKARVRAERELAKGLGEIMSMPQSAVRELQEGIVRQLMEEYQKTGEIDQEMLDTAISEAFAKGLMIDDEFYRQYKPVKDYLRSQAVTISEQDRADIADFTDFRKRAFGTLRIVNNGGLPVDTAYQELQGMAPELFPMDITHPADQLVHMYEVCQEIKKVQTPLERAMGEKADEFYDWAEKKMNDLVERTLEKYAKSVEWKQKERKRQEISQAELERFEQAEQEEVPVLQWAGQEEMQGFAPQEQERSERSQANFARFEQAAQEEIPVLQWAGQEEMEGFAPKEQKTETTQEAPQTLEQAANGTMQEWIQYVLSGKMTPEEFAEMNRNARARELTGRAKEEAEKILSGHSILNSVKRDEMTDEEVAALIRQFEASRENAVDRNAQTVTPVDELIIRKADFTGTPAMEKLRIKIDGSVTRYRQTRQLKEYENAAYGASKMLNKRIRQLKATEQEKELARLIVEGTITADALDSRTVDIEKVAELTDYYMAANSFKLDMIAQRRAEINTMNYRIASDIFRDSDAYSPQLPGILKGMTKLVMNERTPERVVKQIFGQEQGEKIYETYFRPVWVNGAEMSRFESRMLDRVREFQDKDGKKRALTAQEREFAQRLMEGQAARDAVESLADASKEKVTAVAQNLNNGADFAEQVKQWDMVGDEYLQGLAQAYADYLDTVTMSKDMDQTILKNAIETYSQIYNELYEAVNDFLTSHGYKPIGFIKGYAPHFQKREVQQGLFGALKSLGVEKESVSELPASIAGRTADFKPNMKWNPHFQSRKGEKTSYDIEAGYEQYIHYVAEMFYHTDDVMRIRQAVNYFRQAYSSEDISQAIEDAKVDQFKDVAWKKDFLEQKEILRPGVNLDDRAVNAAYEQYVSGLFDQAKPENLRKYSEFVTWMDNYANIVAGKQSIGDRSIESDYGRTFLNIGNWFMKRFTQANVAGNLSSMLNQTAQVPLIQQQLGKYMERAMWDMARGTTAKENFAERSDFLTDKRGVEKLTTDNAEKFISTLYKHVEIMDRMVSTLAVRGRYLQALDQGMTMEQAMKEADDFGRRIMGSRMKGAKPVGYEDKRFFRRLIHIFQVEASNTFDYMVLSDMPQAVQQVYKTKGKAAGTRYLAAYIVGYLLNAFLLNQLTDKLYGGTPAPFDLIGWGLNFVAGGWGLTDEEFLKTVMDSGLERIMGERPFGTDTIDRDKGLDWAGSLLDLGYNVSDDLPYVRNAAGVLGLGDQSLPTVGINEFFKSLGDVGSAVWNQAFKGQEETGLTWAGTMERVAEDLLEAGAQIAPGGRQLKKTVQGVKTMVQGGMTSGYGDNQRLKYPVEQNVWNWARGILFGNAALDEYDAYYASGNQPLTAGQTQKVKELEDMGIDKFAAYEAVQKLRKINGQEDWNELEKRTTKRDAIDDLDATDEDKYQIYRSLELNSNEEEPKLYDRAARTMLDGGMTWEAVTDALNAYDRINNGMELAGAEKSNAILDLVNSLDLDDDGKQDLARAIGKLTESREEGVALMQEAGMDWDAITEAWKRYNLLNEDPDKNDPDYEERRLSATEKATELAKWMDGKNWSKEQKEAVKDAFTFFSQIPAEATSYERFTGAGLSEDSAYELTNILAALEPEEGKDSVSSLQKYQAIVSSGIPEQEQEAAIASLMQDSQRETFEDLMDKGMTPGQYVEYKAATAGLTSDKDEDGNTIPGSKKEKVLAAIDAMNISDSLKTALYFAEGYSESTLDEAPWYNGLSWAGS